MERETERIALWMEMVGERRENMNGEKERRMKMDRGGWVGWWI